MQTTQTNQTVRREVAMYVGLAYSLATAIAVALPHANIKKLLSILVPTVSVAILTFTITPRGRRRELWGGIGLRRAGLRAWPAALLLPLLLCAGAYGTAVATGVGHLDVSLGDATPDWALNLVIGAVIGTAFILGEEIGWRGFLLPRLQLLTGDRRRAALLTGFLHGCFHLPLILIATTYNNEVSAWVSAPVTVAVITSGGIFYAWLWDRSRSVWPVAIAHNTVNTVFSLGAAAVVATGDGNVASVAGETGYATLGVCVVAAVVLWHRARVWRTTEPQVERPLAPAATA
jgi:membrane protease YdiL (CAAX protease family)